MADSNRLVSIDIMRGLTLILMLFVNDLYMPGVPAWLGHMDASFDGMGLADWVFPGFLFMVGMAIPYSISKRQKSGEAAIRIARHIAIRSVSLIIIGVLMLNSGRVNAEFTGIGKNLWALLMYLGVFLIWNNYKETENNFFTIAGLRLVGIALLCFLVMKFRSGEFANNGSLITSWWGILGLIGWGYLVAALLYLAIGDNFARMIVAVLFFLALNIISQTGLTRALDKLKPVFGVVLDGNVPMIVLSGTLISVILRIHSQKEIRMGIVTIVTIGAISIFAGLILRNWFIISKIKATPSWGLLCNGISMLIFVILYWITDIKKERRFTRLLRIAGENSLTTYLAPNIIYYLIWMSGVNILIYKHSGEAIIIITGSLAWSLLMVGLTALLDRYGIRLRL